MDIQATHRVGKKGVTIVKFVNLKFAYEGLRCGKNLKDSKLYGNSGGIYINNSFSIKVGEKFNEISHKSDFLKYN